LTVLDRRALACKAVPQEEKPVRGKLLTIDEAAKYIRMGKITLYEFVNSRNIPFFRPWMTGCGKVNPRPARRRGTRIDRRPPSCRKKTNHFRRGFRAMNHGPAANQTMGGKTWF
jgi:excisionase family DNA binding protein